MKKAIILAAMLALPTLAGQKVIIQQAPVQVAAPAVSAWAVELAATYTWAVPDIYGSFWNNGHCKEARSIGTDITGVYNIDARNAVTLRFGYSWGGEKWAEAYEDWGAEGGRHSWNKARIHTFSLMPGYRYTAPITEKVSWFAGVNAGIANAGYKDTLYCIKNTVSENSIGKYPAHKSAWGFAYSAEVGLRYNFCGSAYGFIAYQYCGNTASPKIEGQKTFKRQHGHQARVGVGFNF